MGQTSDSLEAPKAFASSLRYTKPAESQIAFSGFYRFLGYVRAQDEVFPKP